MDKSNARPNCANYEIEWGFLSNNHALGDWFGDQVNHVVVHPYITLKIKNTT